MPDTSKAKAKAKEALDRGNYEYAIQIMQEILVVDPDDTETRKQLRMASTRFVKQKGISAMSGTFKGLGALASLKMTKDPEKKMRDCEKFLVNNPSHKGVLTELGKAAVAGGHFPTAIQTFEDVLADNADDVKVLRLLADAHESAGDIQKSIEANQRILKEKPNDQEASRKVKDLAASRHSQSIEVAATTGRTHKNVKDQRETQVRARLTQEIRTDEDVDFRIEHCKEQIKERPDEARLYATLGDTYLRYKRKRYAEAGQAYKKAQEISPTDNTYRVKLDELEFMKRMEALAGQQKGSPEYNQQMLSFLEFKRERLEWRSGVYTVDLGIKFNLGLVHFQLAQIKKDADGFVKAIGCFQQTVGDLKNRVASYLRLGQARARLKEYDLAVEAFTEGISGIDLMNQDKMEMVYWRADTQERMGKSEDALKDFTEIYKVDIGFRDVKARMDKLKGQG